MVAPRAVTSTNDVMADFYPLDMRSCRDADRQRGEGREQGGVRRHERAAEDDRVGLTETTRPFSLPIVVRVDNFHVALSKARALVSRPEEEPHLNPSTGTAGFSLRDLDGYYITISALNAAN